MKSALADRPGTSAQGNIARLEISTAADGALGQASATAAHDSGRARARISIRTAIGVILELMGIIVWSIWVGRNILNSDPLWWPLGGDLPLHASFSYVWYWFGECGLCALWNGMANGGVPAFAEQLGGILHPLVPFVILTWGPSYGLKVGIVATLAMAGIAQWWLARVMGLGLVPRLWAAALVVVGGHLAAPLGGGWPILNLSTAASSLVLAPGIQLGLTGRRRAAVVLGVMLGLAVLTGHGYMQLGLLLGILPPFVVFWFDDRFGLRPVWREYVLAGVIAVLISAIYWVPLFHFWPNVGKPVNPGFSDVQALAYQPLNLVINDKTFITREVLGQKSIFAYHAYYIGWIPILLALAALKFAPKHLNRVLLYFVSAIALVYLTSAAVTPALLERFLPGITGMRHPMVIAALAVPLIVGLAAIGLDAIIKLPWPRLGLFLTSVGQVQVNVAWLILLAPLILSIASAYDFSRSWLVLEPTPRAYLNTVRTIQADSTQWIKPPYGEMLWFQAGLQLDPRLKWILAKEHRSWSWRERELPPAYFNITRELANTDRTQLVQTLDGNHLVLDPSAQYAYVRTASSSVPCRAVAAAGNIDVNCNTTQAGALVVSENYLDGWSVSMDGAQADLVPGDMLSVLAPPGEHRFEFRYRPWDVALGFFLTLVGGLIAAVVYWRSSDIAASSMHPADS